MKLVQHLLDLLAHVVDPPADGSTLSSDVEGELHVAGIGKSGHGITL